VDVVSLGELVERARRHVDSDGKAVRQRASWRTVRVGRFTLSVNKNDQLQIYANGVCYLQTSGSRIDEVEMHRELVGELLPELRKLQVLDDLAAI